MFVSLLLSGDVESNPGPPDGSPDNISSHSIETSSLNSESVSKSDSDLNENPQLSTAYLCGTCKEPVTWEEKGLMCEECETWCHIDCQNVSDTSYERLGNSSVVWTCLVCDAPNFSYTLFDLHDIESRNRFGVLSHSSGSDESFESVNSHCDLGHPKAASSPVKPKPRQPSGPRPLRILNVNCQSLKKEERSSV